MRTRRTPAALLLGAVTTILVLAWAGAVDGVALWASPSKPPGLGTGRVWSVAASPKTAGLAVAGTDRGVYVTSDGGVTWTAAAGLDTVRVWVVGFDARNPDRIFAGTDGKGVFLSIDAGQTWTASSTGLGDPTVRSMAFGLDGIAAGTAHGVALSPDGSAWHAGGLDAYSISSLAVAANSPSLVLVAASDRGDLSNGYVFRYSGGTSWQALQSGLPSQAVVSNVAAGPISSSVPKRPLVVTTSKGVFRSGDGGSTWTASTGVPQNLTPTTAIFSPLDPNLVYAGADQGGSQGGDILRSTDGGATFAVADQGLPTQVREVESIAVEQTTPPGLIAALNPSSGGVMFSEIDSTAPPPPPLLAEAPGAAIPATLATPLPTRHAVIASPAPTEAPATSSGVGKFLGSAFHWPVPLVFEVLLVLAAAYLLVRWRQRYYVEGPP